MNVVKDLVRMVANYRTTLKHILVINLINVMYVVKGVVIIVTCRSTHIRTCKINLINVMHVVKDFVIVSLTLLLIVVTYRHTLEHDKPYECRIYL